MPVTSAIMELHPRCNMPIDLDYADAIFVMFILYQIKVMNDNSISLYINEAEYFALQPRFGYTGSSGRKKRWLHHDKSLSQTPALVMASFNSALNFFKRAVRNEAGKRMAKRSVPSSNRDMV